MKYFLVIFVVFIIGCDPSTVQICQEERCGTGWVCDQDGEYQILATAAHVMKDNSDVIVYIPTNNYLGDYRIIGEVVSIDRDVDIAMVKVEADIGSLLKICDPVVGMEIISISNDGSSGARSIITKKYGTIKSVSKFRSVLSFHAHEKMSGSPVLNDGCVVGWIVADSLNGAIMHSF